MNKIDKNKSLKILIVDNNVEAIELAEAEINNYFRACIFGSVSGSNNLHTEIKEFGPDIIISEVNCTSINVSIVLSEAKQTLQHIPVVIITSEKNYSEALKYTEMGASGFVFKENIKTINGAIINALRQKEAGFEIKTMEFDVKEYESHIQKYNRWEKNIPGMVYQFILHPKGVFSFIYVSKASKEMFGLEPEIVVGDINAVNKLMHPDDIRITQKAINHSAITLKPFRHEVRFIINGETKWYKFISKPEMQVNGDIIWDGFMLDNTENKLLEDQLIEERKQIHALIAELRHQNSDGNNFKEKVEDKPNNASPFLADVFLDQNQFKILMDNLPDAIYFKDLESRFIRVNKHHVMKVGEFSENGMLGKTDFDFYDKPHASDARKDELEIMKTGKPVINKVEKEVWPSGKITWVSTTKMALKDAKGNIIGTFGMSRDISSFKLMEEALAQERNLMREIIDAIPDRIYVKDTKGNFVLNNIADMNASGFKTQEEAIGKNEMDLLPRNIASNYYEEDKRIMRTGQPFINMEEVRELVSGEHKWYITTKVALRDIHGEITGMVGISHEITKRKEMESALRESEAQLTNALKIAHLAYWEFDLINDHFIFNDQFFNLLKTTAENEGGYMMASSEYTDRFLYNEDKLLISSEIKKVIATKDPNYSNQIEHRIKYVDGETGYFSTRFFIQKNEAGLTVKAYGTSQDITKRKRAEEALRSSEYFLRKSQFIAHVGSYIMDLRTGIWESSVTIDEIFGIDEDFRKDINGWMGIIHPDERDEISQYFTKQVMSEHSRFEREYRIIRLNDNHERWVLGLGDIEFDSEGTPLRLIGTVQDITERVMREKEKHELENQLKLRNKKLEQTLLNLKHMQGSLVQSEKMASIGQLTAGIAHEINNPLAFVSSNINRLNEYFHDTLELLNKWTALSATLKNNKLFENDIQTIESFSQEIDMDFIVDDFKEMMHSINEGTQRIKKIVEGLRGFAHMTDSSFAKASINQAIDDTLTIVWNELKYKATIEKKYENIPLVSCSIGEIKQVLVNLLVNAAHSIDERGTITITTSAEEAWVNIIIKDTGCGISDENKKRIFDPFFTTKAIGKGTGLGLWVSSSIIEKHGGTIRVESKIGKGSSFTVKLPVEHSNKRIK